MTHKETERSMNTINKDVEAGNDPVKGCVEHCLFGGVLKVAAAL